MWGVLIISCVLFPVVMPKKLIPHGGKNNLQLLLVAALVITGFSKVWLVGMTSALPSHHYDDGLYYQPYSQWLTNYPAVPGLGNVHFRLANNSSWHLLAAVFQYGLFPQIRFNDLNGFVMLLVVFTSLRALARLCLYRENTLSNYLQILLWAFISLPNAEVFFTFSNFSVLTSPAPDLPASVCIWFVFILLLQKAEQRSLYKFDHQTLLLGTLSAFALTIKLSVAPVVLIVLLILGIEAMQKRLRNFYLMSGLLFLLLVPWLIRNVILSGYLVFPLYQIDLFSFDWEMPAELVKYSATHVRDYAVGSDTNPGSGGFLQWVPFWYAACSKHSKIFTWALLISNGLYLSFLLIRAVRGRDIEYNTFPFLFLYLLLLLGCLVWFLAIPDFRFGFGFTVISCLFPVCVCFKEILGRFRWQLGMALAVYLVSTSNFGAGYMKVLTDQSSVFYHPPDQTHMDGIPVRPIPVRGGTLYLPAEWDQCWSSPLPCAPSQFNIENHVLIFRGKSIQQGFAYK
jgi:hypothetical protein